MTEIVASIGGTIGVAVLGTVMMNGFQSQFQANLLPNVAQVVPPSLLAQVQNPQLLLSPQAVAQVQGAFASLGPQGGQLFETLLGVMRVSLAAAITTVFAVGAGVMVVGLVATLFLKEIPLRKTHYPAEGTGGELAPMGTGLVEDGALHDRDRRRALLGLALELLVREARRPDADRRLLAALATAVPADVRPGGPTSAPGPVTTVPHLAAASLAAVKPPIEARGRTVAQHLLEPLASALLLSASPGGAAHPDFRAALMQLCPRCDREPDDGDLEEALAVLVSAVAADTTGPVPKPASLR